MSRKDVPEKSPEAPDVEKNNNKPEESAAVTTNEAEAEPEQEASPVVVVEEPTPPPVRKAARKPLIIDLLRHGQVATPSLFSAPVEEPLGMDGWKQLTIATQNCHWDAVITPPTRRCHDFARLLSQRLECRFDVDARYCELDFGDWIGLSQQDILARDPELLQQYYFQPRRFHAPGGESMGEFTMRVHAAWDDLLRDYAGQHVLILTQVGVIRTIIAKALGLLYQKALRFEVDYARYSRLVVYPDGEVVLTGHGLTTVADI